MDVNSQAMANAPDLLTNELDQPQIQQIISRTQLNFSDDFVLPQARRGPLQSLRKYGNLGKVFILVGIVAIIVARITIF